MRWQGFVLLELGEKGRRVRYTFVFWRITGWVGKPTERGIHCGWRLEINVGPICSWDLATGRVFKGG